MTENESHELALLRNQLQSAKANAECARAAEIRGKHECMVRVAAERERILDAVQCWAEAHGWKLDDASSSFLPDLRAHLQSMRQP